MRNTVNNTTGFFIERDDSMPLIEQVREVAAERSDAMNPELDFYGAARDLGVEPNAAWEIDAQLTERVMRSRGMI